MSQTETPTVVINAPNPRNILRRLPVKKIALVATAAVAIVLAGKYVKDNAEVEVRVDPEVPAQD